MPEEVSRPLPSGLGLSGLDDLGCLCEDKVSYDDQAADFGLPVDSWIHAVKIGESESKTSNAQHELFLVTVV